jgi:hypothetical protein
MAPQSTAAISLLHFARVANTVSLEFQEADSSLRQHHRRRFRDTCCQGNRQVFGRFMAIDYLDAEEL